MRVDLWDHHGGTAYAEYRNFRLGNEKTAYKLNVGRYRGTAGTVVFVMLLFFASFRRKVITGLV